MQRKLVTVFATAAILALPGIAHAEHGSVPKMIKAAGARFSSSFHLDLDAAKVKARAVCHA